MLKVKEIQNKIEWENFLSKSTIEFYPFFQSWNWGEVQRKLDFPVLRLGLYQGIKLIGVCQVVDVNAKRGHYLHLRHGPAFEKFKKEHFNFFIDEIKKIAREKSMYFIRMSPLIQDSDTSESLLSKSHFLNAPIHRMDGEVCWVLDITIPEEELLKNMRKSHRYLIKKASQNELEILKTKNIDDMQKFLPLYKNLAVKKHFVPHKGVIQEFEIFAKDNEAVLFLAIWEKKVIAGALIDFVGDMAIYRHSALDENFRHVPASYLIQWEAILEAKKRGKKLYNFWGIAPEEGKKHPWYGLTLFKMGFGGKKIEFLHAKDLILNAWYLKTFLIETASKIRKGY